MSVQAAVGQERGAGQCHDEYADPELGLARYVRGAEGDGVFNSASHRHKYYTISSAKNKRKASTGNGS